MKNLFERLSQYASRGRISFAMPGHKGGRGLSEAFKRSIAQIDVTELADTENLHSPRIVLKKATERLANVYDSERSFFLTGGSTVGVHIMMNAAYKGGKLLTNRNCHRSVLNGSALFGTETEFLPQSLDRGLLVPLAPTPTQIKTALGNGEGIDAVLITSPDYYGHMADIKAISQICHGYRVPLLVDEAHGAHLSAFECNAMRLGADMAVNSAHKTLDALNQASFLHVRSGLIDTDRVAELVPMLQTSSPSYPIAVSAELALDGLNERWIELAEYIDRKRAELSERTEIVFAEGDIDRTRIVFGFSGYDISGYEAERILREQYNIDIEMADRCNAVAIATPSNTREEIDRLFEAVRDILAERSHAQRQEVVLPPPPKPKKTAREAFLAEGAMMPFSEAAGKISKVNITAYPPGTAIVAIGEEITPEHISYIQRLQQLGAEIDGIKDGRVSVVTEKENGRN